MIETTRQPAARRLVELAKGGDVRAIKEVFDRTLGRPQEPDFIERLEAIEAALAVGGK